MRTDDMYPSTFDAAAAAVIAGGSGEDPVLATLKGARARVERSWNSQTYVDSKRSVCAIGALILEENPEIEPWAVIDPQSAARYIENAMRTQAKEALKLLNEAAIELYPEIAEKAEGSEWNGPLEYLNQEYSKERGPRKPIILACYDRAIHNRPA